MSSCLPRPNGFEEVWLPLPKTLPPVFALATDAKPPLWLKPAKPPEELASVDLAVSCVAVPQGLGFDGLLAKPAKPDCPNAGAEEPPPEDEAPRPPPEPHGEDCPPSWEDCPNPGVLGFPNAGAEGAEGAGVEEFPKEPDPKRVLPVWEGLVLGAPQGDDLSPSWVEEPKDGAAGVEEPNGPGVDGDPKEGFAAAAKEGVEAAGTVVVA